MGLLQLENNPLILKGSGGTSLPTATITYANGYKTISYTNSQGVYTTVTPNDVAGEITDALKGTLLLIASTEGSPAAGSGVTKIGEMYMDGTVYKRHVYRIDLTSAIFKIPISGGGNAP